MELVAKPKEARIETEDWVVVDLQELAGKIGSGITPTGGSNIYKTQGRPFVRSQNIGWGHLKLDDIAYIEEAIHQTFPNTEIKLDDVFLNISGASIGRSSVATHQLVGGNVNQHVCIIRTLKDMLDSRFLCSYLLSSFGQRQIDSFQSGGNREGLNIGQIRTFKIPVPPLHEQQAIAQVLSDTDKLIQSLEKKIAKKKLIKQGVMQQLLTPKEGWEVVPFKSLCKVFTKQTGFDYSAHIKPTLIGSYRKGTIPFIQNKDFNGYWMNFDTDYYIPEKVANSFPRILLDEKCLLISISGKIGNVGVFTNQRKAFIGGAVAIAKFHDPRLLEWVMLYLQSNEGQSQLFRNVKAGSHQNLILDDIRKVRIPFPSLEEQIRIANLLLNVDHELISLDNQHRKWLVVKQGMMQQLLTGKIRLV